MKIKRFEAPCMSDALRMIKKEFGEEAVILSAKNLSKTSRIFGKRGGGKVIVTAAIDEEMPEEKHNEYETGESWALPDFSAQTATSPRAFEREGAGVLERYTPITRTGQQKLRSKLVRLRSESKATERSEAEMNESSIYPILRQQGLNEEIASELETLTAEMVSPDGEESALAEALSQAIETKGWIAPVRTLRQKVRRIVVLIGPNGCGKTATAAKLAARALLDETGGVGIISLDNRRVAGTDELCRFADIMGLDMATAAKPSQLRAAFDRMAEAQLIVIDTPGIAPDDLEGRRFLEEMIAHMTDPEVHLLLSAASQEKVIAKAIRFFRSVGLNHLLPTHLDWVDQMGPLVNQLVEHHLPVSYMASGVSIPEDLRAATSRALAARLLSKDAPDEAWSESDPPITVVERRAGSSEHGPHYVANQNSDIFHRTDCKSVKRISNANALVFYDSNEALTQGFKPCRMCCSEHIVRKPIDRPVRARYAGSRN